MRRTIAGTTVIAVLLAVLAFTSPSRRVPVARPQPSDFGVDAPLEAPFEIGTVMNAQSFR